MINIDKKLNLFAIRQKIEFGLCKKLETFVITKTYVQRCLQLFVKRQNPLFPLTAILSWVILFRKRNQSTLLVLPVSFAGRVSKLKKESLLQALIKMYMLISCKLFYTNFCARNQFLFRIKRLSKFLHRCFEI